MGNDHEIENDKNRNIVGKRNYNHYGLKILDKNPSVLLLDEPTKGLDEQAKEILGKIVTQLLQQGKTIVMVTHDEKIAAYSDRVIQLCDGAVLARVKFL